MWRSLLSGLFLLWASTVQCQPMADMPVAKFNDDNTPYPIYAGKFGNEPLWTDAELELLGKNFDGFYGNYSGITATKANKIRSFRADFQFIKYNGGWTLGDETGDYSVSNIEQNYPNEILYYRVANLASDIDATTTSIPLTDLFGSLFASTAAPNYATSYKSGNVWNFVAWIKIDNEFMRINAVNGANLNVTRGFKSTTAVSHATGKAIVCPVYGSALSSAKVEYRHDEGGILRWKKLTANLALEWINLKGGIWIDILFGNLSQNSMNGTTLPANRIWDIRKNQVYNSSDRSQNAEKGVKLMQDEFYAQFGVYPVIWGNNMLFPTALTDDRIKMLLQTTVKPRPVDGFAQENCYGGYGTDGGSGTLYTDNSFTTWKSNLQSIMYMGEQKLNARPLSLDGGKDNGTFAAEPAAFRHRVLLYSYASYLLAVKVESDDRIYTKLGLTPVVVPATGAAYIKIEPFLQFPIGRPLETHASANYLNYKMADRNVFVRKFENGLVLVNPSEAEENNVSLSPYMVTGDLYNPDVSMETISSLSLPPKNGAILLYKSKTTGVASFNSEKGKFKMTSTSKGNLQLTIPLELTSKQLKIYDCNGRILYSEVNPKTNINIDHLPSGMVFVSLQDNKNRLVLKTVVY